VTAFSKDIMRHAARCSVVVVGACVLSPWLVLGGQAAFSVLTAPGNVGIGVDATLTGPRRDTLSGDTSDNRTA
jgi:hypothetical protein